MLPKAPQSSLGILRVPQLPPPLEHRPLKNPTKKSPTSPGFGIIPMGPRPRHVLPNSIYQN